MKKTVRFRFEIFALICSIIVVALSTAGLGGLSNAKLIGLIAGSFGAGAAMANIIRSYGKRRKSETLKEVS